MPFFPVLLVLSAWADDASLVRSVPSEIRRMEVLAIRPKADHHFSMEAPQKCGESAPIEITPRAIKCQFLKAGQFTATVNVCDDKKTFCKPQAVKILVNDTQANEPVALVKNESLNQKLKQALVPGFQVGRPGDIQRLALEAKKPVFLMISTDWCPPCNEAKEYLLKTPEFAKVSAEWLKVYVDGDSLGAAEWDKVVPFRYYPSFVFLNENFAEIGRYNQDLRVSLFVKWAKEQDAWVSDPLAKLKERVLARKNNGVVRKIKDLWRGVGAAERHADEERLLRWALDRQQTDIVHRLVPGGSFPDLQVQILNFKLNELPADATDQRKDLLKQMAEAAFSSDDWSEILDQLCDEDVDQCRAQMAKVDDRIRFLNGRSGLSEPERASMLGEEYLYLASAAQKLKDKAKTRDFAQKCIASFESMASGSALSLPRGARQNRVPCFEMAERFDEAESMLKAMVREYPSEPTFMNRLARVYRAKKDYRQALVWIEKAEKVAYGYNWFTTQFLKIDTLLDLKRVQDARAAVRSAIAEVQLNSDADHRNQHLIARLRSAQAKVEEFKVH